MNLMEAIQNSGGGVKFSAPSQNGEGEESEWLELCNIELRSGQLRIVDPLWTDPTHQGVLLELKKGRYTIDAKLMRYGQYLRVSRARVFLIGSSPRLGANIDEANSDVSVLAIFDSDEVRHLCNDDADNGADMIGRAWSIADTEQGDCGIAVLDAAADLRMPYVHTGFGDGGYPVYELRSDSERVGVEIEFIKPGTPYPF
jgi:hypothetical protein